MDRIQTFAGCFDALQRLAADMFQLAINPAGWTELKRKAIARTLRRIADEIEALE